jgi:FixJ family two-component response regulator
MSGQSTVESVVFVIDDDAVRGSLKSLFKSVGLDVEVFASADEFLKTERPDAASCLVLDSCRALAGSSSKRSWRKREPTCRSSS